MTQLNVLVPGLGEIPTTGGLDPDDDAKIHRSNRSAPAVSLPVLREMTELDLDNGFNAVLSQLKNYITTYKDAVKIFKARQSRGIKTYVLMLANAAGCETCIGTASILFEDKYYGRVAHIEDVVVDSNYRKKGYGEALMHYCIKVATSKKCYKVVLQCSEEAKAFYESLQFKESYAGMKMLLAI